jgi:signal transduction histidine kinase
VLSVEPGECDAAELVREAVDLQAPIAQQRSQELTADVPKDLPKLCADHSRTLQIFANLIGNAIKFTPNGGAIAVAVRPAALGSRPALEFDVRDTGRGIEPAHLPHVFDRYWQAESGSQGVGLGLFIVRSLVEAQGGRIEVESELGKGATFKFLLPAVG